MKYSAFGLTFNEVSRLKKRDGLGISQPHCVFEVQVALSIEVEALIGSLDDGYRAQMSSSYRNEKDTKQTSVNEDVNRPDTNETRREVSKEQIEIGS